ncbi:hypothetical protein KIN20_018194 [Parelaphostrongylus tenuis]|uniref:Uncharacterized protein n=1 Tax=Parelaphostrongylus tenuis TaxID=148309 RepID=A0AAD5N0T1_PARTN|nr:hypothetical protein KIN20_018194 [Parelaphostrongylus tenuis]
MFSSLKEKISLKTSSERRTAFGHEPARSASAPPRRRWFHKTSVPTMNAQSAELVCDDVTRKLVGAITTWHDIHSNLLQLSINQSRSQSFSPFDKSSSETSISDRSFTSASESEMNAKVDSCTRTKRSRVSLSNPELTNLHVKQMFPELSEHWR